MIYKFPRKMWVESRINGEEAILNVTPEILAEKLGINFINSPEDSLYLDADLPEGWTIVASKTHPNYKDVLDQNGLLRGRIHFNDCHRDVLDQGGTGSFAIMTWKPRYDVHVTSRNSADNLAYETTVYFGNPYEEPLYVAGVIRKPLNATDEESRQYYLKKAMLIEDALRWANENYPNYTDIFAYWGINLEKAPQRSLGTQKTDE